MKLAVVGVGSAGSRIVNQILDREKASGRNLCNGNALLINSTTPAFNATEHVPPERRLTIGDVYWKVDSANIDDDPDLAAEVAREEQNEINRAFDLLAFHEVDGVLVVAGLAGGTGGGAGAVVIDQLKEICDEPVYAVGILPSESEGQAPALTAARSLQSFVGNADNVIAFDNDAWRADDLSDAEPAAAPGTEATEESDAEATETADDGDVPVEANGTAEEYARANAALAERLVALFAAGEFDGGPLSENRLDPSDIMQTLETGGISSIGYASTDLPRTGGVRSWIDAVADRLPWSSDRLHWPSARLPWSSDDADGETDDEDEPTDAAKIDRLVRRAARSELTLPCAVSSADRALIILSGPTRTLSRKGFESGRYWLENEADIVDVKAGDEPHDRATSLTAVVLFSNVTDVPRIDELQATAVGQNQPPSTDETRSSTANPP